MAIINGTNGDDTLSGTNVADEIYGLAGNDTLIGFDDDDVLEGGAGADDVFGSGGFDYASYRSSNSGVVIDLVNFVFQGGHADDDHLYSIEGVIGSAFADTMWAVEGRQRLSWRGRQRHSLGLAGARHPRGRRRQRLSRRLRGQRHAGRRQRPRLSRRLDR